MAAYLTLFEYTAGQTLPNDGDWLAARLLLVLGVALLCGGVTSLPARRAKPVFALVVAGVGCGVLGATLGNDYQDAVARYTALTQPNYTTQEGPLTAYTANSHGGVHLQLGSVRLTTTMAQAPGLQVGDTIRVQYYQREGHRLLLKLEKRLK